MVNRFIDTDALNKYHNTSSVADTTRALVMQQKAEWDLCAKNYKDLDSVLTRSFEFDNCLIKVQFNPGRIVSSSAKVDKKSIKERKCFLCSNNLPEPQKAVSFSDDYMILVNPFPIFHEHLTLPKSAHVDQKILPNFSAMLSFTSALGKYYSVFYNGPKCGASAPDHMHYQAGINGVMPFEGELDKVVANNGTVLFSNNNTNVVLVENYLRPFVFIESDKSEEVLTAFNSLYNIMDSYTSNELTEPMMNILTVFRNNKYGVLVFPRHKHRPDQYFLEDNNKILLSPASVDMGGLLITPREEDFNKITNDDIIDIFKQVAASNEQVEAIKGNFKLV